MIPKYINDAQMTVASAVVIEEIKKSGDSTFIQCDSLDINNPFDTNPQYEKVYTAVAPEDRETYLATTKWVVETFISSINLFILSSKKQ